ncbi:MAG: sigma-70 family RNA polymerase sigma factor [Thermostichales cyanobacterium BF3_bins_165]
MTVSLESLQDLAWLRQEESGAAAAVLSPVDLIRECQQGSPPPAQAFRELMRRYQPVVDRLLYHLAPDWQDRHDLTQEVWIRVYRHLPRLQDPLKFRSWLGRITTNLFYDELRKRKRHRPLVSLDAAIVMPSGEMEWELPTTVPGPEDHLTTQEFYEQLRLAVQDLPEAFRQTIVLREIQGLSYEEIAELTGVSLGTVKSRIARARSRLQATLQAYLEGKA